MITISVVHGNPDAIWQWGKAELGAKLVGVVAYGRADGDYNITVTVKDDAAAAMVRLFWDHQQTN